MATEIPLSIPDQYVNRVLTALTELSDKNIELMATGEDFDGHWSYSYAPKQTGETNKDFAARVIKENIRALVRLYDYAKDRERHNAEVAAISQPVQNVPDDIIS